MNGYNEEAKRISDLISKGIGISDYKKKIGERLEKIFKSENATGDKIMYSYFYKKYMGTYSERTASRYFDRWRKGEQGNILEYPEVLNALHTDEKIQAHIGYLLGFDLFDCSSLEEYKRYIEHDMPTYLYNPKTKETKLIEEAHPYIDYDEIEKNINDAIYQREQCNMLAQKYFPIFDNSGLGLIVSGTIKEPEISMIQSKTGISKDFDIEEFNKFLSMIHASMNQCFNDFEVKNTRTLKEGDRP